MVFTTRFFASLISLPLILGGCVQSDDGYGFNISHVAIETGYKVLKTRVQQDLTISAEARDALEHGVALTVEFQFELRDALTLTLLHDESRNYEISYQPMLNDYRLVNVEDNTAQVFPRLRHALRALANLNLEFQTGSLAPGRYELRTRTRLDDSLLPAPMRLPTRFSSQWQHDSKWSTWRFEISV